jgi:biopolymer transport protein TolR
MVATVSRGRGRRTINEINMVPFIDVMLVLLIIFMVTAPLIAPSVIDLPSMGKANKQPDRVIQVSISKSGKIELKADANAEPVKRDCSRQHCKLGHQGAKRRCQISRCHQRRQSREI